MGARHKYPQFENLTIEELTEVLRLSKLSPRQKEIAVQCIAWTDMTFIEIGEANGGYNRTTISRWMKYEIIPELERIMARMNSISNTIKAGA